MELEVGRKFLIYGIETKIGPCFLMLLILGLDLDHATRSLQIPSSQYQATGYRLQAPWALESGAWILEPKAYRLRF